MVLRIAQLAAGTAIRNDFDWHEERWSSGLVSVSCICYAPQMLEALAYGRCLQGIHMRQLRHLKRLGLVIRSPSLPQTFATELPTVETVDVACMVRSVKEADG